MKKRLLKILCFFILCIFILYIIYSIIKFFKLNSIQNSNLRLQTEKNYSFTIESYDENNKESIEVIKCFYKDGKSKKITYKDGKENLIEWQDTTTNENIIVRPTASKASTGTSKIELVNIPRLEKIGLLNSFITSLSSTNLEGINCYIINSRNNTIYIEKDNGFILQRKGANIITDKNQSNRIINFKDLKFDFVSEEDVSKPDLTGYQIDNIV